MKGICVIFGALDCTEYFVAFSATSILIITWCKNLALVRTVSEEKERCVVTRLSCKATHIKGFCLLKWLI